MPARMPLAGTGISSALKKTALPNAPHPQNGLSLVFQIRRTIFKNAASVCPRARDEESSLKIFINKQKRRLSKGKS